MASPFQPMGADELDVLARKEQEAMSAREKERLRRQQQRELAKNDPKKIVKRKSYEQYKKMLEVVKTGDKAQIMNAIHDLLNNYWAFGTNTASEYAKGSLDFLLKQEGLVESKVEEASLFKPMGDEEIKKIIPTQGMTKTTLYALYLDDFSAWVRKWGVLWYNKEEATWVDEAGEDVELEQLAKNEQESYQGLGEKPYVHLLTKEEVQHIANNMMTAIAESKKVEEASPFQPMSPDEVTKVDAAEKARLEAQRQKEFEEKTRWVEIAKAELEAHIAGTVVITDTEEDHFTCEAEGARRGMESEWLVCDNSDTAERMAVDRARDLLDSDPESFATFLQSYITMSDTDRRIFAQEESDNYVENLHEVDLIREADLDEEYDAAEAAEDNDRMEEILEQARDAVREEKYDEYYDALDDPVQYFVEEQGLYTIEDLMTASFITIDIEEAAQDLVDSDGIAAQLDYYDGAEIDLPHGAIAYGVA